MRIQRIKQLSLYGYAAILVGFVLSVVVLTVQLGEYEQVRRDHEVFASSYSALLRMKETTESLLTTHDLDRAREQWQLAVAGFTKALLRLEGVARGGEQRHLDEIRRLWRITLEEIESVRRQLLHPEFQTRRTLSRPLLRRAGESFTRNSSSATYVLLSRLVNAIGFVTQHQSFILEEFDTLRSRQQAEEAAELSRIERLAVIAPAAILTVSLLLAGLVARWMVRVETQLLEKERELERLNRGLRREVEAQVEEIRHRERLLLQQSKLAAMGEMMGNIAHQWRQPLNGLGVLIQDVKEAYEFDELDEAYLERMVEKSTELTRRMSGTIDEFREFFRPDRERAPFEVGEAVRSALRVIEAGLAAERIDVVLEEHDSVVVEGYHNEFAQVVLNLLSNARDSLAARDQGRRRIRVDIERSDEGRARVTVMDNGGGIPDSIIEKVFEPYFTTKFKGEGTGIGLYRAKMVIEQGMGGRLRAENVTPEVGGGCWARFTIEV